MKERQIVYLKTSQIKKSPILLRSTLCPYELQRLALSIKAVGIIEPLIVRINEDGDYEVVSGNRRLLAAEQAGLLRLPCIVKKTDSLPAYIVAISENIQRKNLTPFEEAEALERLVKLYDLTDEAAAQQLGFSPSAYTFKRELIGIKAQLRERIEAAGLGERHARLLLKIPEESRDGVLDKIIAEELGVAEAEKVVNEALNPKKEKVIKTVIGDLRLFSNSLNKMVDTMKMSGIKASSQRVETENSIEYRVTILK